MSQYEEQKSKEEEVEGGEDTLRGISKLWQPA